MLTDEELGQHIGAGWFPIARSVLEILDQHGFELTQIKEKFGYIRIYVNAPPGGSQSVKDTVHAVILAAENASGKTCEECGAEGKHCLIRGTWWKTRCEACKDK